MRWTESGRQCSLTALYFFCAVQLFLLHYFVAVRCKARRELIEKGLRGRGGGGGVAKDIPKVHALHSM